MTYEKGAQSHSHFCPFKVYLTLKQYLPGFVQLISRMNLRLVDWLNGISCQEFWERLKLVKSETEAFL